MKGTVYVGMSGGVDSSLTAALLKEQGYTVKGIYMKNWTEDLPGMICPWAEDFADAKRVAVQLDIPLEVYDFQTEYKQKVVDYMIEEYVAGRTPNPDIMCNQEVKFKLFLNTAIEDGADLIATGHYASTKGGRLYKAKDTDKDQTYFLGRVSGDALIKTLFPLGGFTKKEVRKMANERGLSTAAKKDSQGICFVGKVGVKDFLSQYVTTEPGEIIEKSTGKRLGMHDGAIFYTIGQRHGLNVGGGLPYYVVAKDMTTNKVFVSTDLNDENLWRTKISAGSVHWINPPVRLNSGGDYSVRLRHRAPLIKADLKMNSDTLQISLSEPERAVTPGQSTVIYQGGLVLGSAVVV